MVRILPLTLLAEGGGGGGGGGGQVRVLFYMPHCPSFPNSLATEQAIMLHAVDRNI